MQLDQAKNALKTWEKINGLFNNPRDITKGRIIKP